MRFIFKWNENYTILRNNLEVKYYAKNCDLNKYFPSLNTNIFPSGKKNKFDNTNDLSVKNINLVGICNIHAAKNIFSLTEISKNIS